MEFREFNKTVNALGTTSTLKLPDPHIAIASWPLFALIINIVHSQYPWIEGISFIDLSLP